MFASFYFCSNISVPELEKYVDPAYSDELTLSQGAKAEIILAGNLLFSVTFICDGEERSQ